MTDTSQRTPPPPPAAEAVVSEPPPPPPAKRGKREKRAKAPKPPKPPKLRRPGGDGPGSLFDLTSTGPSKDELDRMAAAELGAAISGSLDLLQMSVPGATSPEEAGRALESKLGPPVRDRDAGIPDHPVYSGDALVYYQFRRHYGRPNSGGSFQRTWYPGGGLGGGGAAGGLPPMLGS
jgi:hypothetical protein